MKHPDSSQLTVIARAPFDVYYEGPDMTCDNCSAIIESAYGDPDES